jgi:hypothetical protein
MIEFYHTVTRSEAHAKYLNLNDEEGRRYGHEFPPHGTPLEIFDQEQRQFSGRMHAGTQLTAIAKWFRTNRVGPNCRTRVGFDDREIVNGRHVVRLEKLAEGAMPSKRGCVSRSSVFVFDPKEARDAPGATVVLPDALRRALIRHRERLLEAVSEHQERPKVPEKMSVGVVESLIRRKLILSDLACERLEVLGGSGQHDICLHGEKRRWNVEVKGTVSDWITLGQKDADSDYLVWIDLNALEGATEHFLMPVHVFSRVGAYAKPQTKPRLSNLLRRARKEKNVDSRQFTVSLSAD